MPLYTKKEWAKMCGMNTGNLSNYVARAQVIYTGDLIDDQLPVNAEFLKRRTDLLKTKPKSADQNPKNDTQSAAIDPPSDRIHIPAADTPKFDPKNKYALDAEKVFYEIENKKIQNDILQERLIKLKGQTLPTEMAIYLFSEQLRNQTEAYKNAMEKQLAKWAKASNVSKEIIGKMRKDIIQSINEANKNAIAQTKKGIKKIIRENSDKKDVGEHDI